MVAPMFERGLEQPLAGAIAVPSTGTVVTEGNYLLLDEPRWRAVRAEIDVVWHLTLDESVRVERLVARHVEFGKTPDEARAWVARVDAANAGWSRPPASARTWSSTSVRSRLRVDVDQSAVRLPSYNVTVKQPSAVDRHVTEELVARRAATGSTRRSRCPSSRRTSGPKVPSRSASLVAKVPAAIGPDTNSQNGSKSVNAARSGL